MKKHLSFALPFASKNPIFSGIKLSLHRNLSGFLFPSKISQDDRQKALAFLHSQLKNTFLEAHIEESPFGHDIYEAFPRLYRETATLFLCPNRNLVISCFDTDHLVCHLHLDHLDPKKLLQEIKTLEEDLKCLNFAFSPKLGYLTAHPEYSGHGIKLEAYLFCPSLETFEDIDPRLSLKPYFNHESFFVLSTLNSTNFDLSSMINLFTKTVSSIISQEQSAQNLLKLEQKEDIIDQAAKALAVLKGAYQLSFQETLNHLLSLKQGYHMGLYEGLESDISLELLLKAQKSHLSERFKQKESHDDWLHERASWMNEILRDVFLKKS